MFDVIETAQEEWTLSKEIDNFPPTKGEIECYFDKLPFMEEYKYRMAFIAYYGFSIPTKECVQWIKENSSNIVDVAAGSGYWAKLLECKAYDNNSGNYDFKVGKHHEVEDVEALDVFRRHQGDFFVSWPDYQDPWMYKAALLMEPGRRLFYIGEGYSGCTADDAFHEYIESDCWKIIPVPEEAQIPSFKGIHDYLNVYEKVK